MMSTRKNQPKEQAKNITSKLILPSNDVTKGNRVKPSKHSLTKELGNYTIIKTIGCGNFAKVKLAKHRLTSKKVAIKIVDKTQVKEKSLVKLFREVQVLKHLDHPNIVKLYEVLQTETTLYLVMEYVSGGELFDYILRNGKMTEMEARKKFRQVVSAVYYCHLQGVVHRDLKAENLLLDEYNNVKLVDFGFSNYFSNDSLLDTFCGSPPYAAPELYLGQKYTGPEVDVWALGVILFTLVTGSLPFDGHSVKDLKNKVLACRFQVPFYLSPECDILLKRMIVRQPQHRKSLGPILKDRWMNLGYDPDLHLRPFKFVQEHFDDTKRIVQMVRMGFNKELIKKTLAKREYNHALATYLILERRQLDSNYVNVISMSKEYKMMMASSKGQSFPPLAERSSSNSLMTSKEAASASIGNLEVFLNSPRSPFGVEESRLYGNSANLKRRITHYGEITPNSARNTCNNYGSIDTEISEELNISNVKPHSATIQNLDDSLVGCTNKIRFMRLEDNTLQRSISQSKKHWPVHSTLLKSSNSIKIPRYKKFLSYVKSNLKSNASKSEFSPNTSPTTTQDFLLNSQNLSQPNHIDLAQFDCLLNYNLLTTCSPAKTLNSVNCYRLKNKDLIESLEKISLLMETLAIKFKHAKRYKLIACCVWNEFLAAYSLHSSQSGGSVNTQQSTTTLRNTSVSHNTQLLFEVQICKLIFSTSYGIKMKRIMGDYMMYKDVASLFLSSLDFVAGVREKEKSRKNSSHNQPL